MALSFKKPVQNQDQPSGRIALRLRELLTASPIESAIELRRRTNYSGASLSDALSGRSRQSIALIASIVRACVPDPTRADAEIYDLIAIRDATPLEGNLEIAYIRVALDAADLAAAPNRAVAPHAFDSD